MRANSSDAKALLVCLMLVAASSSMAADADQIARGKYLFDAADCLACHAGDKNKAIPSGGLGLDTQFGTFRAPNITPDHVNGIGGWSKDDFMRAMRLGLGKRGEYLYPVFPYPSFTNMSDQDIGDVYAYLMTLPGAPDADQPHKLKFPFAVRSLMAFWRALFFSSGPMQPDPAKPPEWNRGNYLVHAVAHCEECHTPRNALGALRPKMAFSGNVGGPDGQNAPNITSDGETGIGGWSVTDIQRLLKVGMTPDSDQVGSGMKAVVRGTSKLTDEDRHAIAVYLKTVAPVHIDAIEPAPASSSAR